MKNKKHFGFVEMIGSVVLLLLEPMNTNNKRYLDKKYYKLNRIVGSITIIILIAVILYFLTR